MIASVASVVNTSITPTSPGRASPRANIIHTAKSTANTMPATASANSSTRREDWRRATAWCSKKFIYAAPSICNPEDNAPALPGTHARAAKSSPPPSNPLPRLRRELELHFGCSPDLCLLLGRNLKQRGGSEIEHAGDDAGRK